MSKQFSDLITLATKVRDHYNELQDADGHKRWDAKDRTAGLVGDVGDLSKLVMAKYKLRRGPKDIDEALAHELSDILWAAIVIADELGVDLEEAFVANMKDLHRSIELEKSESAA